MIEAKSKTTSTRVDNSYRRITFTDRSIQALKSSETLVDYWDESLRGFGVRVSPAGRKTWIVMYRRPSGLASRHKLGTYPAVTLADARLAAKKALGAIEIDG